VNPLREYFAYIGLYLYILVVRRVIKYCVYRLYLEFPLYELNLVKFCL